MMPRLSFYVLCEAMSMDKEMYLSSVPFADNLPKSPMSIVYAYHLMTDYKRNDQFCCCCHLALAAIENVLFSHRWFFGITLS